MPENLQTFLDHHAPVVHFRAPELLSRARLGGPKEVVPPEELWPNILSTLHIADVIRAELGIPIRVVSGYRSPEYNRLVRGAPGSRHMKFRALDLTCDNLPALILCATRHLNALSDRGIATGLGLYDKFVHIDVGDTVHRRRWDGRL